MPPRLADRLRDPAPPEAPRLPGIHIEEELGRGATGVVFAARCERPGWPDQLAIKVLRDEAARNARSLERFEREAEVLRGIAHPGVVDCYGIEIDEHGKRCLLLEHARGPSIERSLLDPAARLSTEQVYGIVHSTLDTLAAVHERGIVHRDLKPSNLILSEDGGVRVLDFGIARFDDGRSLTRTSDGLGTPTWSAPEQADAAERVDARADLFAVGRLILRLAPNEERTISLRALGRWATANDPGDRPPSAQAMAQALQTAWTHPSTPILEGERIGAYRVSTPFLVHGQWVAELNDPRLGIRALGVVLWGNDGRCAEARLRTHRDRRVRAAETLREAAPGSLLLCVETLDASQAMAVARALIDGGGPVVTPGHRTPGEPPHPPPQAGSDPEPPPPSPKSAKTSAQDTPAASLMPLLVGAGLGVAAAAGVVGATAAVGLGSAALGAAAASRYQNAKGKAAALSGDQVQTMLDELVDQLLSAPPLLGGHREQIPQTDRVRLLVDATGSKRLLVVGSPKVPTRWQLTKIVMLTYRQLALNVGARGMAVVWPGGFRCVELLPNGKAADRPDLAFLA